MSKSNLIGKRFGKLIVVDDTGFRTKSGFIQWLCSCDCGDTTIVSTGNLLNGNTQSCGCLRNEATVKKNKTHGHSKERLYRIWSHMKERCYSKTYDHYNNYGGRGITVCDEWLNDYMSFREWAYKNGYDENAKHGECTIDRINVNGNYCPENCRWVDMKTQHGNTTQNKYITFNGETHCFSEWENILGLSRGILSQRINRDGWSIEKALTTPIKTNKHKGDDCNGTGT